MVGGGGCCRGWREGAVGDGGKLFLELERRCCNEGGRKRS